MAISSKNRRTSKQVSHIVSDYKAFVEATKKDTKKIMKKAADLILKKTIPYVPVDTGALRQSGTASIKENTKGVEAQVAFGGYKNPVTPTRNAPTGVVHYATVVHEDVEGWAVGKYKSGQYKFLEVGAIEAKPAVDRLIKRELAAAAKARLAANAARRARSKK